MVFGVVYHVVFHMLLASFDFFIAACKHMEMVLFMNHILTYIESLCGPDLAHRPHE